MFKKKENIKYVLISCILFFVVALPFRLLQSIIPGVTEIRPANALPPVLGIIWGPYGALGISLGNLISDIMSGSSFFICISGFFANFFYAYIPYKMWYTYKVNPDDALPNLGNVNKILKYIYIVFVNSFVVSGLLSVIFEIAGFSASANSYILLFFNNFDFAILLGIPLLLFIKKSNIRYIVPEKIEPNAKNKQWPLYIAAAIGLLYFAMSFVDGKQIHFTLACIIFCISAVLVLIHSIQPFTHKINVELDNTKTKLRFPIKAKVTIGFLLLAITFLICIGILSINMGEIYEDKVERWMYIYTVMGVAINIVFSVAILFLWYVEKKIVNPLEELTRRSQKFIDRDKDIEILNVDPILIDTGDEIQNLAESFNEMMTDIFDYMENLKSITKEKERIGAELNVATKIQASMLPCIFPAFPELSDFDIYASMLPAKEVGGDFYDFFLVDEDRLAVVMADVSGKGVPAALFMVIAKTLIKNNAQYGKAPKDVFETVNDMLCENNEAGMFVTAFMGILEISTGRFEYVNAGHNPPIIKRKGKDFEWLATKPGFVLAGMEGIPYTQDETTLNEGDMLYLYTDGVTEAVNPKNELFTDPKLLVVANKYKNCTLKEFLENIKAEVDIFADGAEQADDITMLAVKILGGNK